MRKRWLFVALLVGALVIGVTAGTVLANGGAFGDRYRAIAEAYDLNVTRVDVEWGKAVDPEEIRKALKTNPGTKAVIITHNETSTGVTNDLAAISKVVKGEFSKLLLVDAISSMGCLPLPAA